MQKEIESLQAVLAATKGEKLRQAKQKVLMSKHNQLAKLQTKIGIIEKKIAEKAERLNQTTKLLQDAEAREAKRQQQSLKRQTRDQ